MAKKMPARLVALSASAVATIYVAGLLSTKTGADSLAAASAGTQSANSILTTAAASSTSAPSVVVGASSSATPNATASPVAAATSAGTATPVTSTPAGTSTYANGTYSATGTSSLGNVTVSVTISGEKITNVQITRVTTKFPVSRIASLPNQVIQNQTSNVNVVTGATYSSQAFRQAVQLALGQALGANFGTAAG